MSRFFIPIEFEKPKVEEKKEELPDKFPVDITNFIVEFNRVISAVEQGDSGIVKGTIRLKGAPIIVALERFSQEPTADSFRNFLNLAAQDINYRARTEFLEIVRKNASGKLKKFLVEKGFTE